MKRAAENRTTGMSQQHKILMISLESLLDKFNHILPREIVRQTGWELKVFLPLFHRQKCFARKLYPEKTRDQHYDIITGKTTLTASHHYMFFHSLMKYLLSDFQPDIIDLEAPLHSFTALQTCLFRNRYSPRSKIVLRDFTARRNHRGALLKPFQSLVLNNIQAILLPGYLPEGNVTAGQFAGKVVHIPPVVNNAVFRPRDLPELCTKLKPTGKILLGLPGKSARFRNLKLIFQAAAGENIKLFILGDCAGKKRIARLAKSRGVEVQFSGTASHEEIAQYLNCLDIFIIPEPLREITSTAIIHQTLEAMSSGTAVLAADSGLLRRLMGKETVSFRPHDVSNLRENLARLCRNKKQRSELGWQSRRRILQVHSARRVVSHLAPLYRQLLQGR